MWGETCGSTHSIFRCHSREGGNAAPFVLRRRATRLLRLTSHVSRLTSFSTILIRNPRHRRQTALVLELEVLAGGGNRDRAFEFIRCAARLLHVASARTHAVRRRGQRR